MGGNAVDAAVATALALAVTHPSAGNLGGGGFLLLRLAQAVEAIDFRENSPAALTDKKFWEMIDSGGRGAVSVGVPGTVAGLFLAHFRHGRLKWSQVVIPAEELARDGYRLGERQAKTIQWAAADLKKDPVAKKFFFAGALPQKAGVILRRPDLALALARIRKEGPAGFYEGPTAQDLVDSLGGSSLLTLDDLKGYRAMIREPLFFDFGEFRIITMPAPSAGGVALTQNLQILSRSRVAKTPIDSPERLHLIAEASRRAQAERQFFVVSPDEQSEASAAASRKRALDPETWLKDHPIDPQKPTPSASLHNDYEAILKERQHTTHLSVVDAEGGLVSCTVTLSGSFGSRIFSRETGIVLNNSVASFSSVGVNTPKPGRRTTSSMAPTLALRGSSDALVLGSPGGDTIPSTIAQTFLHLGLDGMSLSEAVNQPRFHQGFFPQDVLLERNFPLSKKQQGALTQRGHRLVPTYSTIGDANIAALINGVAYAVADPREGGLALAARAP